MNESAMRCDETEYLCFGGDNNRFMGAAAAVVAILKVVRGGIKCCRRKERGRLFPHARRKKLSMLGFNTGGARQ